MTHTQKVVKVIQEVPVHPSGMDKNKMEWALLRVPLYKSQEALRKWGLCIQGAPVLRAAKLLNLLLHSAPGWLTNLEQQPLCGHTCTWLSPCGLLSPPDVLELTNLRHLTSNPSFAGTNYPWCFLSFQILPLFSLRTTWAATWVCVSGIQIF